MAAAAASILAQGAVLWWPEWKGGDVGDRPLLNGHGGARWRGGRAVQRVARAAFSEQGRIGATNGWGRTAQYRATRSMRDINPFKRFKRIQMRFKRF
jgi:hypothetical protein